ncbi:hypothetical protein G3M48_003391, partial [Beauveria asiatica]
MVEDGIWGIENAFRLVPRHCQRPAGRHAHDSGGRHGNLCGDQPRRSRRPQRRSRTPADFHMLRSPEQVLLWQALRATTAAPFYFPPQVIHGVAYQDGGMTYNNPSALALAAAREQFPEKPDPGILVSCGAGTEKPSRARSHDMTNISRTAGGR